MTTTFRYYGAGPWFTIGTGRPMLLAVGADPESAAALRQAIDDLHEPAPPAVVYSDLSSGPGSDLEPVAPRPSTSVLSGRARVFAGSTDDPTAFGPLLAPLLVDLRRFGMLTASTDVVQLHFNSRPAGATSPVITWAPDEPDRWTKRELVEGRSFQATDLRSGQETATFAALAPHANILGGWSDLAVYATFRGRQALNGLLERTRSGAVPTPAQVAKVIHGLGDVDGVFDELLDAAAPAH